MKKLDEVKHWKVQLDEEYRQNALDMLIAAQITGLEKLVENNGAYVKSAMAYNMLVGLVEQVRYYAHACFRKGEENLDQEMSVGAGVPVKNINQ